MYTLSRPAAVTSRNSVRPRRRDARRPGRQRVSPASQYAHSGLGAHALPPPLLAQRIALNDSVHNSLYCRLIAGALLLLAVAAQIFSPTDSPNAPLHLVIPSFFYPASWSVAIFAPDHPVHARSRHSPQDRSPLAPRQAQWSCSLCNGSLDDVRRLYFVVAGIAPYLFLLFRIAVNSGAERSRWIDILRSQSRSSISQPSAPISSANKPAIASTIYSIKGLHDARRGLRGAVFSRLMAYVLGKLPPLYDLSWVAYNFVQIPIAIVAAFHWKRKSAESFSILPAFILGSIIGYGCYWLTPAIGPSCIFRGRFSAVARDAGLSCASAPRVSFQP